MPLICPLSAHPAPESAIDRPTSPRHEARLHRLQSRPRYQITQGSKRVRKWAPRGALFIFGELSLFCLGSHRVAPAEGKDEELSGDLLTWQRDIIYDSFNLYRANLDLLPQYTQNPTLPLADRFCGELTPFKLDPFIPLVGEQVFYLVTGVAGGVESSLGVDSDGFERPNDWPCP